MAYWQGRFSKYCPSLIVVLIVVLQDVISVKTYDPVLKDFPDSVLQRHITLSRHHPVCVLFRQSGKGSRLEKNLHSVWRNTTETIANFTSWEVGSFVFQQDRESLLKERRPDELPTLRCYLGQSYYQEFTGKPHMKNLKAWISSLVKHHSEQLQDATPALVDEALEIYNVIIVAFPDTIRHVEIEEMAFQRIKTEIPGFREKYKIRMFTKQHISKINLDVYIQAREIPVIHTDYKTFENDVINSVQKNDVPVVAGFYGSWAKNIQSYLNMLKRSYQEFQDLQARFKFVLVDLSENDNKKIITKWIHTPFAQQIPFTLLFYKGQKYKALQYPLTDNRPTPLSIYTMMKDSGVGMVDGQGEIIHYSPWGYWNSNQMSLLYEGPYGSMCGSQSHNQTENSSQYYWKKWKINKKRKTKKKKDNKKWHQQIHLNIYKMYTLKCILSYVYTFINTMSVCIKIYIISHNK
ncbi:hypothetical protein KUTeg_016027 [Tegillarca granosa]|uniref:Thioredoxin-like fold domain-containing protein n=1 Tax=Tegillarca granosa TaxID=220873 RepID=A0ABQ9EJN1_TEGGR|nr:hypothetical protein KUTeg_016027 [Tegillarca granosa]